MPVPELMRAAVYERYGPPDVVEVRAVPVPAPGAGHVLVQVAATSVNLSDWECLVGSPAYARIGGLRSPARRGARLRHRRHRGRGRRGGDRLRGGRGGLRRQHRSSRAGSPSTPSLPRPRWPPSPPDCRSSRRRRSRRPGRSRCRGPPVCGRGSGWRSTAGVAARAVFAIQLAKAAGAHVTAVDNAGKLEWMRTLGADEVVDYRADDFTRRPAYDLILDLVAHRSVRDYRRALAPGGRYRVVGGTVPTMLRVATVGGIVGLMTGRRLGLLAVRGARRTSCRWPTGAWPARWPSTSTGRSPSTRPPRRWRTSAKAARWARSW